MRQMTKEYFLEFSYRIFFRVGQRKIWGCPLSYGPDC